MPKSIRPPDGLTLYEHHSHHLIPWRAFLRRAGTHFLVALLIIGCALTIGTVGYHTLAPLPWLDAFLNASMILGGMGPVDRMDSAPAKLFAALYALFSGLMFIAVAGVLAAPWVHRLLHWVHLEQSS